MAKPSSSDAKTLQLVRDLTEILEEAGLTELEYSTEDVTIRLARTLGDVSVASVLAAAPTAPAAPPAPAEASEPAPDDTIDLTNAITSPMVGTVYLRPEPGAAVFINEGDSVSPGQTLVIVEAMKVMNPITTPRGGVVRRILVNDAQPVEFGEPLVIID